jgi:hypothetical protein
MSDSDWAERFPDMRPVRTSPALVRINGIGCGNYGSRDHDPETGTYVTTYCFSFLFLPVLALTAYRVADAPNGGWYFIGRVPLSGFAKAWNALVLLAAIGIAGFVAWNSHIHSTDYIAGQKLAEAEDWAAKGQMKHAAELYRDVATGESSHRTQAAERLRGLLDDPRTRESLDEATGVFRVAVDSRQRIGLRPENLEEQAEKIIERHAQADARGALALLDVVAPVVKEPRRWQARRRELLECIVAREPNDLAAVSELALTCEAEGDLARCEALLMPLKDRLGDTEGARILGQILLRKDKFEDAAGVLEPYTTARLPLLRMARERYDGAVQQLVQQVQQGSAPGFPYLRFRDAEKEAKRTMFQEYLAAQLQENPNLKSANEAYQKARQVVSGVLDLGFVLLRRAQSRRDPAAREADLEKAEKLFVAIQNDEAAESSTYRLSLGQVYYWLGKHDLGRKKFDEALAAERRSPRMLQLIGTLLREVGAHAEASALLEEAYSKEQDQDRKHQIALSRSLMATEVDHKITWLQRANPKDEEVKANLSEARAEKAMLEGKLTEAEPHLREAIDLYRRMPENAAILNNGALAHLTLYRVTGDRKLLEKAETMLDRAIALSPQNSILMENAAETLLDAAVRDVIGPAIDLAALKKSGRRPLLAYLYDDVDAKRRLTDRLLAHPATIKGIRLLERVLILAPKNPSAYRQLLPYYRDQRNIEGLRGLAERLEKNPPDLAIEEKRIREHLAGRRDEKIRKDLEAQLDRHTKLVETTGKGPRGVTYAVAATELAGLKIGLAFFGANMNPDEIVTLAESAHTAAPSSTTRGYLEMALLFRASQNLARKEPAFAKLLAESRHVLETADLIALVLNKDGKLRQQLLAEADVRRTLELLSESGRRFPTSPGEWDWAMLHSDAAEAERIAKGIRDDPTWLLVRRINLKLSPWDADTVLHASWGLQAVGQDQESAALLKQLADRGVQLPRLP